MKLPTKLPINQLGSIDQQSQLKTRQHLSFEIHTNKHLTEMLSLDNLHAKLDKKLKNLASFFAQNVQNEFSGHLRKKKNQSSFFQLVMRITTPCPRSCWESCWQSDPPEVLPMFAQALSVREYRQSSHYITWTPCTMNYPNPLSVVSGEPPNCTFSLFLLMDSNFHTCSQQSLPHV